MKFKLSTTHIILLSFIVAIIIGSLLLSLPISVANGKSVSYIDALFTATTSVCVTGLVTVPTFSTWSGFGQLIILILIQIGGLGIITIMSIIMISLHKKFGIKDRFLLQDAFNLNSLSGITDFVKKVIIGTFVIELVGALLYMIVFIPEFGIKGIWISIFNSISAFCNAGIDVISDSSLSTYVLNPIVNFTTCFLIIIGGLGFVVWWDLIRVIKEFKNTKMKCFRKLTLHSKIVLSATCVFIVFGALLFFVFEYGNDLTINGFSLFGKIGASLFQSITTRTAGFATISQKHLTNSSAILSLGLMFIGGSPVGTAGGVKTVTIVILIAAGLSTIRNKDNVELFNRKVLKGDINKAIAVVGMSFIILFLSTLMLSAVMNADILDILYETTSATATVGLTRDLTPSLNLIGKIIIICTMYLGRVGPISLAIAFSRRKKYGNDIKNPVEAVSIG